MTTPGAGEFRFGTNIEAVRQEIEQNLSALSNALSTGLKVSPQGNQFLENLNREITQVADSGARKMQELAAAFANAQRQASAAGTAVVRPGTGETLSRQSQTIAVETTREMQAAIQRAMSAAPAELKAFDFQGLAQRGTQELYTGFQQVFTEVRTAITRLASEVGGNAGSLLGRTQLTPPRQAVVAPAGEYRPPIVPFPTPSTGVQLGYGPPKVIQEQLQASAAYRALGTAGYQAMLAQGKLTLPPGSTYSAAVSGKPFDEHYFSESFPLAKYLPRKGEQIAAEVRDRSLLAQASNGFTVNKPGQDIPASAIHVISIDRKTGQVTDLPNPHNPLSPLEPTPRPLPAGAGLPPTPPKPPAPPAAPAPPPEPNKDRVDAARERAAAQRKEAEADAAAVKAAEQKAADRRKEAETEAKVAAADERRLRQALLEAEVRSGNARHVTSSIAQKDGEFYHRSGPNAGEPVTDPTIRNNAQRTVDLQDRREEIAARRESAKAANDEARADQQAARASDQQAREAEREATRQQRSDEQKAREDAKIVEAKRLEAEQIRLAASVARGDARRTSALGGSVVTNANEVYRRTGERVTNPLDVQNAVSLRDAQVAREQRAQERQLLADAREAHENREGLTNNFLGGLTSRGFANNRGFSGNLDGLAASAGTLVKYQGLAAVIGGLSSATQNLTHETLDFIDSQTAFNIALGEGQHVSQGYVNSLSDISRAAGSNVGEALDTAARAVGAFADASDSASRKEQIGAAVASTASQLRVLTGKDLKDATGDLLAISTAYGLVPEQLQQVNDAVVNARRNFSADPGQISQGLANFGIIAKQAGFSVGEAANLIGLATSRLDESGQLAATRLSKVFTIIGGAQGRTFLQGLNQTLSGVGAKDAKGEQIQVDVEASGPDKLKQLATAYGALGTSQRSVFLNALGGTANTRELVVVLEQMDKYLRANERSAKGTGAAMDEYRRRLSDMTGVIRQLNGDLKSIAVGLANSGFLDIFGLALKVAEPLIEGIAKLIELYDLLPDKLKTIIALYFEWIVAMRLLVGLQARSGGALIGGAFGRTLNARAANTGIAPVAVHTGESVAATAGGVTTVAGGRLVAAESELAVAVARVTAAEEYLADSTTANGARLAAAQAEYIAAVTSGGPEVYAAAAELTAAQQAYADSVLQGTALLRAANAEATAAQAAVIEATAPAVAAAESVAVAQAEAAAMIEAATAAEATARATATEAVTTAQAALAEAIAAGADGIAAAQVAVAEAEAALAVTIEAGAARIGAAETAAGGIILAAAETGAAPIVAAGAITGVALLRGGTAAGVAVAGVGRALIGGIGAVITGLRAAVTGGGLAALSGLRRGGGIGSGGGFLGSAAGTATVAAVGAYAIYETIQKTQAILDKAGAAIDQVSKGVSGIAVTDFNTAATDLRTTAKAARDSSSGIFGSSINFLLGNPTGRAAGDAETVAGINERAAKALAAEQARQATGNAGQIRLDATSTDTLSASLKQMTDSGRSANDQFTALIATLEGLGVAAKGANSGLNANQGNVLGIDLGAKIAGDIKDTGNLLGQRDPNYNPLKDSRGEKDRKILSTGSVDYAKLQADIQNQVQQFSKDNGGIPEDKKADLQKLIEAQIRAAIPDFDKLSKDGKFLVQGAAVRFLNQESEKVAGATADPQASVNALLQSAIPLAQSSAQETANSASLKGTGAAGLTQAREFRDRLVKARTDATAALAKIADNGGAITPEQLNQLDALNAAIDSADLAYINARAQHIATLGQLAVSKISPLDKAGRLTAQANTIAGQLAVETDPDRRAALQGQANDIANQQADQKVADANSRALVGIDPRNTTGKARQELTNANRTLSDAVARGATGQGLADLQNAVADKQFALAQANAQAAIAQAQAGGRAGDSASQARASLNAAQIQLNGTLAGSGEYYSALAARNNASFAVRQSGVEASNSQILANVHPGSQLDQAAAGIRVARNNLALAFRGTKEWYDAIKALNDAQYQYSNAVREADANRLRLGSDLTNPVAQAAIDLRVAQRALRDAQAQGAPGDVVDQKKLDVRNAQNAQERAAFDQRFQDAQTNEQLGRISHTAYIKYLQGEHNRLVAIRQRTRQQQDELNQVDQALKAANEQLQGQFNIGDIKVPTPYEVRRAIATDATAHSSSYQNTTNNTITINGTDTALVTKVIQNALGTAATGRVGVAPRKL